MSGHLPWERRNGGEGRPPAKRPPALPRDPAANPQLRPDAQPESTPLPRRQFAFDQEDFEELRRLTREKAGITIAAHKQDMVYARLARRLRELKLNSFREYRALITRPEGAEELVHFVNALTTNLTRFFREAHHFEHLAEEALPEITRTADKRGRRLRLWSAGCSSGEEPYSLSMVLHTEFADLKRWDTRILATDIDSQMVATGKAGTYSRVELSRIPDRYRANITVVNEKTFQMTESLRRLIAFKQLNLLDRWPMKGPFDIIFCRNVVIYFDRDTQRKLFERFADILRPDGWLYIGHSENLFDLCDRFEREGRSVYRRCR